MQLILQSFPAISSRVKWTSTRNWREIRGGRRAKRSQDSSASLSHSQRRRRRFRGNVEPLVTIRCGDIVRIPWGARHLAPSRSREESCSRKSWKIAWTEPHNVIYVTTCVRMRRNIRSRNEEYWSLLSFASVSLCRRSARIERICVCINFILNIQKIYYLI